MEQQIDRRRGRDLAAHYRELLARQEESGLSVVEFARRSGLSWATLYSWRRRLARGEDEPKLVEVHVPADGESAECRDGLELVVGDRYRICVERGFDELALERLLAILVRC